MAIYHLSVKTVSRAKGKSATAAAAYRAGESIVDERTGEVHDYTRKQGVISSTIVAPSDAPDWHHDRAQLWNQVEFSEKRKNSTVAREFEIALPIELSPDDREKLAKDFAAEIVERHGCVADVCLHKPDKKGDQQNYHAHILCSTRRLTADGFGEKTRELDDRKIGSSEVTHWRERFATLQNKALEKAHSTARVDHRSLEDQSIERLPTQHLGPAASSMERKGIQTRRGDLNRAIAVINKELAAIVRAVTHPIETAKEKMKKAGEHLGSLLVPAEQALSLGSGGQSATQSILDEMWRQEWNQERKIQQQERERQEQQRARDLAQQERQRQMVKEREEKLRREMEERGIKPARGPSKDSGMSR